MITPPPTKSPEVPFDDVSDTFQNFYDRVEQRYYVPFHTLQSIIAELKRRHKEWLLFRRERNRFDIYRAKWLAHTGETSTQVETRINSRKTTAVVTATDLLTK